METQPNPTQPNPTQPNSTQPYPTHKNNKPTHTFPSTRPLFFSATRPLSPPTRRPLLLPTAAAITFLPCPLRPSPSISWSGGLVSADISLSDTDETAAPDDYGLVGGDSAVFDLVQENIIGSVLAALEVLWIDNSTGYGGAFVDAVAAVSDSHEMVGQVIWCLAHMMWIGNTVVVAASLGLIGHHLFGVWNGDRRVASCYSEAFEEVKIRSSIIPFAAILDGRQRLPKDFYKEFLQLPYLTITAMTIGIYLAHPLMQAGSFGLHW